MLDLLVSEIQGVPVWNWALQGVAVSTAYYGAKLNARIRISGFYLWIVSNVALVALNAIMGLWLMALLYLLFLRLNVIGIIHWSEQHPSQRPKCLDGFVERRRLARRKTDQAEEPSAPGIPAQPKE